MCEYNYSGVEVVVKDRGTGKIVGVSQKYNGTFVVFIDGNNKKYITKILS